MSLHFYMCISVCLFVCLFLSDPHPQVYVCTSPLFLFLCWLITQSFSPFFCSVSLIRISLNPSISSHIPVHFSPSIFFVAFFKFNYSTFTCSVLWFVFFHNSLLQHSGFSESSSKTLSIILSLSLSSNIRGHACVWVYEKENRLWCASSVFPHGLILSSWSAIVSEFIIKGVDIFPLFFPHQFPICFLCPSLTTTSI